MSLAKVSSALLCDSDATVPEAEALIELIGVLVELWPELLPQALSVVTVAAAAATAAIR